MKAAILCTEPELHAQALQLSASLNLPLIVMQTDVTADVIIQVTTAGLQLIDPSKQLAPFKLDFLERSYLQRWQKFHTREPLARALGIKPGKPLHIVDATAGFGRDSLLLTRLGCNLTLIEQQPIIAAVLQAAVTCFAAATPNLPEVKIIVANSLDYLPQLQPLADVIYLDPMFPKRRNAAEVKKASQWLRYLAGEPLAAEQLLTLARKLAPRVVVKRPSWAEVLSADKPSLQLKTENYRFDIYRQDIENSPTFF